MLLEHKGLKRVGTVLGKSLLVGILVVQTHPQSKGVVSAPQRIATGVPELSCRIFRLSSPPPGILVYTDDLIVTPNVD